MSKRQLDDTSPPDTPQGNENRLVKRPRTRNRSDPGYIPARQVLGVITGFFGQIGRMIRPKPKRIDSSDGDHTDRSLAENHGSKLYPPLPSAPPDLSSDPKIGTTSLSNGFPPVIDLTAEGSDGGSNKDQAEWEDEGTSQAGPSRLPMSPGQRHSARSREISGSSTTSFRRPLARPDVSRGATRSYPWAASYSSAGLQNDNNDPRHERNRVSQLKARAARASLARKALERHGEWRTSKGTAIKDLFKLASIHSARREKEREFKEKTKIEGADSKEVLRGMLASPVTSHRTVDTVIRPPRIQYDPNRKKRAKDRAVIGIQRTEKHPEIEDILASMQLEKEADDERVRLTLTPRIPDKLKPEEEAHVSQALRDEGFKRSTGTAVMEHGSLKRLRPDVWLDDEVINYYGGLLLARSNADGAKLPKIHYFNSFFYGKMENGGYTKILARWTKKTRMVRSLMAQVDIFAKDILVFPLNLGNAHWTAAAVNMKAKRVEYYDSMGYARGMGNKVFDIVLQYLEAEHKDKKGSEYDTTDWDLCVSNNAPQQDNGNDCGVFSCQTMEAIARGKDLANGKWEFSAKNMPFMRRMMVYEISKGELYKRW